MRKKLQQKNTSTLYTKLFIAVGLIAALASCRDRELDPKPEKVKNRKTEDLVLVIDSLSQLRPNHLYTRVKTTYADTNQTVSFRTSIQIAKDSAVSALITKANIPIAQALLRPDSVLIGNKMSNCYIKNDLGYFKEAFGIEFSYKNIEELILGLPIGFDSSQTYFQINDNYQYIISSKKKREVRKELKDDDKDKDKDRDKERDKDKDKERERERERERDRHNRRRDENPIIIQYYINGDLSALNRIFIDSPEDTTSINIQYQTRDSVENYLIPHDVVIEIKTPRNNVYIEIRYDKTEVNKPEEIVFIIPEDYEDCGKKEK